MVHGQSYCLLTMGITFSSVTLVLRLLTTVQNVGPVPRTMWHLFRYHRSTIVRNDQDAFLKLRLSELPIRGCTNARTALFLETVMLFRLYIVHGSPINDQSVCLMEQENLTVLLINSHQMYSADKLGKNDRQQFCTAPRTRSIGN